MTNAGMKKISKPIKKSGVRKEENAARLNEPQAAYSQKQIPELKEFSYADFKKIADKAGFTLSEWASILHISERTLQRYAKNNGAFASINAERALQVDKVLKEGKNAFGSYENFYSWLKRNPAMPEGNLSVSSLSTYEGIEKVLTQLSRIQHGLFS
jgi:putative toxin-antitoxin system antitoxin component (TIGR02293 family)